MKKKHDPDYLDAMHKNPNNWRGPFYFNRKDPRLTVPKFNPTLGWTFNFASPYAWIVLIALILIIILSQLYL